MGNINYMQVVPNSHSFGSLENIVTHYKQAPEELTKEYLLIGLENTKKRGYEIKQHGDSINAGPVFPSIRNMIRFIESPDFDLNLVVGIVQNTLQNNIDLKCKRKMKRQEVYERLDTERDYQDLRWTPRREANGIPDEEKAIAEWINYMEYHLSKAKQEVYFLEDEEALAEVRKVAALGVRCMEIHGCPERVIPNELLDQK